jgi:hypothetical protein
MTLEDAAKLLNVVGDFIARVGFPAAMAGFFVWRLEPILREIAATMGSVRDFLKDIR